jgi:hypothetical protein
MSYPTFSEFAKSKQEKNRRHAVDRARATRSYEQIDLSRNELVAAIPREGKTLELSLTCRDSALDCFSAFLDLEELRQSVNGRGHAAHSVPVYSRAECLLYAAQRILLTVSQEKSLTDAFLTGVAARGDRFSAFPMYSYSYSTFILP